MQYWLVKSEPGEYSWENFLKDGSAVWDGVRNFQARNNLRKMKRGDMVLYYHSADGREVVGVAKVTKEFFSDPTASDPQWVAVELKPVKPLTHSVKLNQIKFDKRLQNTALVKQSRLSVMPFKKSEFNIILNLSRRRRPLSYHI